jgi:ketosteroid isomerase-like protein
VDPEAPTHVKTIIGQVVDGLNRSDHEAVLAMLADQPGDVVIGTDPEEWVLVADMPAVIDQGAAQANLDLRIEIDDIAVHASGDAAWVEAKLRFVNSSGAQRPARLTAVLTRNDGVWKIRQLHASLGVPNAAIFSG